MLLLSSRVPHWEGEQVYKDLPLYYINSRKRWLEVEFTIFDFSHACFGFSTCLFCGFGFQKRIMLVCRG